MVSNLLSLEAKQNQTLRRQANSELQTPGLKAGLSFSLNYPITGAYRVHWVGFKN